MFDTAAISSGWPVGAIVLAGVWLGVLGAFLASFLGVVAERLPRGESIWGRSHCACGRQLKWYELIPVLSWAWLALAHGDRAVCCGAKVPLRYILSEGGLGLVFAGGLLIAPNVAVWAVAAVTGCVVVLGANYLAARRVAA